MIISSEFSPTGTLLSSSSLVPTSEAWAGADDPIRRTPLPQTEAGGERGWLKPARLYPGKRVTKIPDTTEISVPHPCDQRLRDSPSPIRSEGALLLARPRFG